MSEKKTLKANLSTLKLDNGNEVWTQPIQGELNFESNNLRFNHINIPYSTISNAILNKDNSFLGKNASLTIGTSNEKFLFQLGDIDLNMEIPFKVVITETNDLFGLDNYFKKLGKYALIAFTICFIIELISSF